MTVAGCTDSRSADEKIPTATPLVGVVLGPLHYSASKTIEKVKMRIEKCKI